MSAKAIVQTKNIIDLRNGVEAQIDEGQDKIEEHLHPDGPAGCDNAFKVRWVKIKYKCKIRHNFCSCGKCLIE